MDKKNIQGLYKLVGDKKGFLKEAKKLFGLAPLTIKNNLILGHQELTEERYRDLHSLLINWLAQEEARKKELKDQYL